MKKIGLLFVGIAVLVLFAGCTLPGLGGGSGKKTVYCHADVDILDMDINIHVDNAKKTITDGTVVYIYDMNAVLDGQTLTDTQMETFKKTLCDELLKSEDVKYFADCNTSLSGNELTAKLNVDTKKLEDLIGGTINSQRVYNYFASSEDDSDVTCSIK